MESRFFKGLFTLLLILCTSFIFAKTSKDFLLQKDKKYFTKIFSTNPIAIPEDPTLFVIAGINYLHQNSFCEINLEAYNTGRLQFQLTNLKGEILFSDQKSIREGSNNIGLSIKDYPVGIYHLEMSLENKEKVLVIEKISDSEIRAGLVSKVY